MDRKRHSSRSMIAILAMTVALATLPGFALADSHEGLVLGTEDLGKSREELGSRSIAQEAQPADEVAEPGEGKAPKADVTQRPRRGPGKRKSKAEGKGCPRCRKGKGPKAGARGYEQCVETSIRGGNAYDESARVCRALFP